MSDDVPTPLVWILMIAMVVSGIIFGLYMRKSNMETICDHHYKLRADYEKCMSGTVPKGD